MIFIYCINKHNKADDNTVQTLEHFNSFCLKLKVIYCNNLLGFSFSLGRSSIDDILT